MKESQVIEQAAKEYAPTDETFGHETVYTSQNIQAKLQQVGGNMALTK